MSSKFTIPPKDLLASVVVFLVALPLCMGIAIASGVPPALGLVTGIVGGILIGTLAGSPLQVSGPAAGLAVLVYDLVTTYGLEALGVAVLFAGALQAVAALGKVGRYFRAVSPAVIQGMLSGIGVLIFASQFHVMVDDKPPGGGLDNLLTIPSAVLKGISPADGSSHHMAALIGLITIALLVGWNVAKPKKLASVPGPLVGVVGAALVAALAAFDVQFVSVPSSMQDNLNIPRLSSFSLLWTDGAFLGAAVAFGIIASAETLLCATAVDRMHTGERTNYDKELFAQGVGNMVCGALGALPATGVIVRSSANVEAGATTRASAIVHGFWLLILVVAFPVVLELIPMSALGAILVYTGYRLLNPQGWKKLWAAGRSEFFIYAVTVTAIVSTDLLKGVVFGVALSLFRMIYTFAQLSVEKEEVDGEVTIRVEGAATFLRLPDIAEPLESIPAGRVVHVDMSHVAYVDYACWEMLRAWAHGHEENGGKVTIDWKTVEDRTRREQVFSLKQAS